MFLILSLVERLMFGQDFKVDILKIKFDQGLRLNL